MIYSEKENFLLKQFVFLDSHGTGVRFLDGHWAEHGFFDSHWAGPGFLDSHRTDHDMSGFGSLVKLGTFRFHNFPYF